MCRVVSKDAIASCACGVEGFCLAKRLVPVVVCSSRVSFEQEIAIRNRFDVEKWYGSIDRKSWMSLSHHHVELNRIGASR